LTQEPFGFLRLRRTRGAEATLLDKILAVGAILADRPVLLCESPLSYSPGIPSLALFDRVGRMSRNKYNSFMAEIEQEKAIVLRGWQCLISIIDILPSLKKR